ncbi:hypothetical protein K2173_003263 [Erythroxylum novogranatense]|uniref:LysM domain receptor-like kinase 3 n=1 Tax=Erythroxylum novogranatense TaxID=1862640 RepID=A0AAV8SX49_9ROSI|nr:hypothetical protein K2173_003263 [Erythroxylum novogranatense]
MASHTILQSLFTMLAALLVRLVASDQLMAQGIIPFNCSPQITTCEASLYHINRGHQVEELASFYSVNSTQIKPISRSNKQDYLITVPCSCSTINGSTAYFYTTPYTVKLGDTFFNVSSQIYSGQAWKAGDEERLFITGDVVPVNLLCGCLQTESQVVITYTVQDQDTISDIASLLSSTTNEILSMNSIVAQNPRFIDVGWVLFVPTKKDASPAAPVPTKEPRRRRRRQTWPAIVGVLSILIVMLIIAVVIILLRRKKSRNSEEDPKTVSKTITITPASSLRNLYKENMQDVSIFESERPIIFSVEEIEAATSNFAATKKIGEGGYGTVFYGKLSGQEVAIKKMKSNKSHEFFAELKVLCKVHHINVVELLGYASGDNHFYLVYEYVKNGSLSDHLHDPLLKGHKPLSWTARTQIALDAAKGIEYIHDHTKARYVHRDIKTSNILLDETLRAKVADFGMAKLVERSNDDELIATRLVGTPGYLPPEFVKELQVTTRSDVFAFGVVLAELITGQRALIRDSREPTKMKSLITVIHKVFEEEDPMIGLEEIIDENLKGCYSMAEVYKMAEIADWCLSEDAMHRPEMGDILTPLAEIKISSIEYEASSGGSNKMFSGLLDGR